jgi:signal recognition particle subunit SRP54
MDKLPAQFGAVAQQRPAAQSRTRPSARIEGIINSMTPTERTKPELIKASPQAPHRHRRRNVGAGGESPAQPVRADAEDDEAVLAGGMAKMMRGMKGMIPGLR